VKHWRSCGVFRWNRSWRARGLCQELRDKALQPCKVERNHETQTAARRRVSVVPVALKKILNLEHPLVQLAGKIDRARFDAAFAGSCSEDLGAPAKAIRLMVGL
jgi:hypothetical protein